MIYRDDSFYRFSNPQKYTYKDSSCFYPALQIVDQVETDEQEQVIYYCQKPFFASPKSRSRNSESLSKTRLCRVPCNLLSVFFFEHLTKKLFAEYRHDSLPSVGTRHRAYLPSVFFLTLGKEFPLFYPQFCWYSHFFLSRVFCLALSFQCYRAEGQN